MKTKAFKFTLNKKIFLFTMIPFAIVGMIISVVTVQKQIRTEEKLILTKLNSYATLLESDALSLESISQKEKLEAFLDENIIISEFIRLDYSTPYSTDPLATHTSLDKDLVEKAFKENRIRFLKKDDTFAYIYPIVYKEYTVGVFHVKFSNKHIKQKIFEYIYLILILNFVGLVTSFFIIRFLVQKGILKDLDNLVRGSNEVAKGNLDYTLDIRSDDEIGEVSKVFNDMTLKLKTHMVTLEKEITERKQAQKELMLVNFALNNVKEAVFVIDDESNFFFVNEGACKVLGYTKSELLHLGVADVDADFPMEMWLDHWQELKEKQSLLFTGHHKKKNGMIFPVEVSANFFHFGDRDFNLALVRDITERKEAQKELMLVNFALNNIKDAMYVLDETSQFSFVNDGACKALEYTKEELLTMGVGDIDPFFPMDNWDEHMQKMKRERSSILESYHRKKDGTLFPVEISANFFHFDGQDFNIALAKDITERKETEEELTKYREHLEDLVKERTEELKQKDEIMIAQSRQAAMGEMIGMIAHQWRQPLAAISMSVNNVLLDIELDSLEQKELSETLKTIEVQIQHLSKTIDDFRNFFKQDKQKEEIKVSKIIDDTLQMIGTTLKNNNIAVNINIQKDLTLNTYPNEMLQVLINILSNAKDITLERKIENGWINIETQQIRDDIIFTICDNAGGIPKEVLPKIFEPYFTTKNTKGSSGLGLYMSKTIVEKHLGGRLSVENTDKGVCFEIRFPI